MARLPASLADNLPNLLKSRPKREIIENEKGSSVCVPVKGEKPPYFVTNCEACLLDFTSLARLAQITVEDCEALDIRLCPVIASIELVKCESIKLQSPQVEGTISLDMSRDISLQLDAARDGLVIYTSSCDTVVVKATGQPDYTLPARDIVKQGRYKTWKDNGAWRTQACNLYGDAIEPSP